MSSFHTPTPICSPLPPFGLLTIPGPKGWRFPTPEDNDAEGENVIPDPVKGHEGFTHLRDVYFHVDPEYKGRFTVPVLYDKIQQTIVSNESSEILRMFGTEVSFKSSRIKTQALPREFFPVAACFCCDNVRSRSDL